MARETSGSGQYLQCNDTAALSTGNSDFTWVVWFKLDAGGALRALLSKYNSHISRYEYALFFDQTTNKLRWIVYTSNGSGTVGDVSSAGTLSTGQWYWARAWHDAAGNQVGLQVGGQAKSTATRAGTPSDNDQAFTLGGLITAGPAVTATWDGCIAEPALFKQVLTDAQADALAAGYAPPLVAKPACYWPLIGRYSPEVDLFGGSDLTVTGATAAEHCRIIYAAPLLVGGTVVNHYTLTAAQGAYTLGGQPVALYRGRRMAAASGSLALSGSPAGLRAARRVTATRGAFTLSGLAVGLRAARRLSAARGLYPLAGQSAGLRAARRVGAGRGSYLFTVHGAGLRAARRLAGAFGPGAVTGRSAGLRAARRLGLGAGLFTCSGPGAGLRRGRRMSAGGGLYPLAGRAARLLSTRRLPAAGSGYTVTGQAANLLVALANVLNHTRGGGRRDRTRRGARGEGAGRGGRGDRTGRSGGIG